MATLVTEGFATSTETATFFLTTVFRLLGFGLFAASGPRSNSGVSAVLVTFFRGARVVFLTVLAVLERVRVAFGLPGVAPALSAPVGGDKSLSMVGEIVNYTAKTSREKSVIGRFAGRPSGIQLPIQKLHLSAQKFAAAVVPQHHIG